MSTAVFTSLTIDYLDRALVLLHSARQFHPEWHYTAVVVDEGPRVVSNQHLLDEFDDVLLARDLGIADVDQWLFGHDVVEACTGVKGAALMRLLEAGHEAVVYLDPDTAVFGSLDPLVGHLEDASIVLTPHRLRPETELWAIRDHELGALRTGVFNFGCFAVARDDVGRDFAAWWAQRLHHFCRDDVWAGLFTDQKWGNHVPVFFPRVAICRDPGINVASWNLRERNISMGADGEYVADGTPLRLFHFTKALTVGVEETVRNAGGNIHVAEIWRCYLSALQEQTRRVDLTGPWAYGLYEDGSPVLPHHRHAYREDPALRQLFPRPLSAADPALSQYFAARVGP